MAARQERDVLTLAAIRKRGKNEVEYLFNERQRIYTLSDGISADVDSRRRLEDALRRKRAIGVTLDPKLGLVKRVHEPTKSALEKFARTRIPLEKPDRSVRIDLDRIDPTTFNLVDRQLKWPAFRLCTRVVPSYAKAKEIFDFCAQLSCNLPGPYTVAPCIPFQYVRDGCYARAHQMRRIITERYKYCCEKVFSFANQNYDKLAVTASKWGGCCVTWWYHVAPLVRVRITLPPWRGLPGISLVLAMVIDPGMFDKPVLLSTWLAAQQNSACHPNAHVSMYSIQPGSAYAPANYQGTAFSTDPGYTLTEGTLVAYAGLTTC